MPPSPRIAVMLDPDKLGFREAETLRGIARYAEAGGWHLVLDPFAVKNPAGHFDGILAPPRRYSCLTIRRSAVPVVCISWSRPAFTLIRVVDDRYAAGRLAARHLVERGYRNFAYLGFSRQSQSRIERDTFAGALRDLGHHPAAACTFKGYAQMQDWMRGTSAWLNEWLGRLEPPVGIYVARPGFARVLAQLALARGLRIPEDVGLIAADDDPALCELSPALTSIRFDYAELGYRAAELLDRLTHGEPPPRRSVLIKPTLIPRKSTDRQAVGDDMVAHALWFIDSRRTEPIDPRQVAAGLGVAQRTLARRLRAAGRGTIAQEIARARVEHAKLLLEDLARSRVRAQRRRRAPSRVRMVFDGPPPEPGGEGWRQWAEDPRRRAALVETRPDGTEWVRRHPLPMPDTPLVRPGRGTLAGVAHGAGFGSVSALSRAFRRFEGIAPTRWRREPEALRSSHRAAEGTERPSAATEDDR